tara:strand:+ start:506 stop:763 length:258 start_codon:yes stop_codon:yes gene_type:complete
MPHSSQASHTFHPFEWMIVVNSHFIGLITSSMSEGEEVRLVFNTEYLITTPTSTPWFNLLYWVINTLPDRVVMTVVNSAIPLVRT